MNHWCIRSKIILLIAAIAASSLNCYLLKQGIYIIDYDRKAVDIDSMLKDSSDNVKLVYFLQTVKEIRQYAIDSVGLKKNKNYSKYVKIDRDYLVNVLSACDKTSFNQYQWCFPLFGCVPYKGFFEKKDAEREARKLSEKEKDVNIDEVDAFSTLGILSDPIFSFMQSYSIYGLASLIIHEQTHATIFIKNQIRFNEEAASFVGTQGAINFIKSKYGENSEQYKNIFLSQADHDTYVSSLRNLYQDLKYVYDSKEYSKEKKLAEKEKIINAYKEYISRNYDSLFKTQHYKRIEKAKINNAFLAVRMTYSMNLDLFTKLYVKKNSDLKATVSYLKKLKKTKSKDIEKIIESEVNK